MILYNDFLFIRLKSLLFGNILKFLKEKIFEVKFINKIVVANTNFNSSISQSFYGYRVRYLFEQAFIIIKL